jgi:hypothetical protein
MAKKTGKATAKPKPVKVAAKLPNVWILTRTASLTLWQHKKLFAGITLIYGLLNVVFGQSLASGSGVSTLKQALDQVAAGHFSALGSSLGNFVSLISSAGGSSSTSGGAYQTILALMGSLAVIWALRQVAAGVKVRIRDAYYRGMYPLVPFVLVLFVISLQLLPLLIGASVYGSVINNGIAVLAVEKLAWALVYILLALFSLYWISSSLFALYIVALPDMTPMKALRSARQLVRHRRWTVLRKILWMPVVLLAAAAIIMLPIIIWLTPLAQWVFFLLNMFSLAAIHAYMYTLYRELLNE